MHSYFAEHVAVALERVMGDADEYRDARALLEGTMQVPVSYLADMIMDSAETLLDKVDLEHADYPALEKSFMVWSAVILRKLPQVNMCIQAIQTRWTCGISITVQSHNHVHKRLTCDRVAILQEKHATPPATHDGRHIGTTHAWMMARQDRFFSKLRNSVMLGP